MTWRLLPRGVLRLSDGAVVMPDAPAWAEYVAFLRDGGVPQPMDVAPIAPTPFDYEAAGRAARERQIDRIRAADPIAGLLAEREIKR